METTEQPIGPWPDLSQRERQVADMLVTGANNHEVAEELGIAIKTVDTHRGHILKKLKLRNNVELALYAVRRGYITLAPADN